MQEIKMTLSNTLNMSTFVLMNQIASNIVSIRKKMHISQKEIADEYGIDQNGMSRLERGERKVEAELLVFLSKKFNLSIDEIINYHQYESSDMSKSHIANEDQTKYNNDYSELMSLRKEKEQMQHRIDELKFTIGVMTNAMEDYKRAWGNNEKK